MGASVVFPASAMPVLVTLAYLYWGHYEVDWLLGLWALVSIVLFMPRAIPGATITTIAGG